MQTRLMMLPLRTSLFQKLLFFAARLHKRFAFACVALNMPRACRCAALLRSMGQILAKQCSHGNHKTVYQISTRQAPTVQPAARSCHKMHCVPGQGIVTCVITAALDKAPAHDLRAGQIRLTVSSPKISRKDDHTNAHNRANLCSTLSRSTDAAHLYDEEVHQLPHNIEDQGRSKHPEELWWLLGCQVCPPSSPKHPPPRVPDHLWHWRIPVRKERQARQQMYEHAATKGAVIRTGDIQKTRGQGQECRMYARQVGGSRHKRA